MDNSVPTIAASNREWLETDGRGGFASGTVGLIRTRRYHALLLVATEPPTGRFALVNGMEVWAETPSGRFPLCSQAYSPDVIAPDCGNRIEAFDADPWPRWTFRLEDGVRIEQEILVSRERGCTILTWRQRGGRAEVRLSARPLLSGRDSHSLHHENPAFRFDAELAGGAVIWRPYDGVPAVAASSNGRYVHEPLWYRGFLYEQERARGLDFTEDLASPGAFLFDLSAGEAALLLEAHTPRAEPSARRKPLAAARALRSAERRRRGAFRSRLERSADAYIVARGSGKTILAGYPWFTDWGRDTFIALRGLCLSTGRLEDARQILLEWAGMVSEGMLPNRFPDNGGRREFNSVDASLWYVIAVYDYLEVVKDAGGHIPAADWKALSEAIGQILSGYEGGTRYRIQADADGLLAAGVPGVQLTWMDAKVGDWVVTPRVGKPVEVEALWINALRIGGLLSDHWSEVAEKATASFSSRFWNEAGGCLYDVVDCDHVAGAVDSSFRPNQIFAVGGLPVPLLTGERARRVVEAVEARLLTPMGLRSLAPEDPAYAGHYGGSALERDTAYHQGTVWPWLLAPFVEAWLRVRDETPSAKREARARFLDPLLSRLDEAGLGHICEIADGDPPHAPRGCPFQAWSVGEALRLDRLVLMVDEAGRG
ncbi:MAG TPA: amylo-alpha-1,6-glucosidase [Thermoanaerobaculia bacterium]|nr:amylo-alpha-1,6-glucosidase [Thermoanaerobaculia bacterium]